jgi:hypothetical protein
MNPSRDFALPALLALLLAPVPLRALASGADFLSMEVPARPAGMAGAFVAFTDDANAFQWDPAALGALDQPRLSATHFSSIADTNFDAVAFAQPLKVWGADAGLGLGLQYDSTSNFTEVDANGNDVGTVENYDILMDLAGGLALSPTLRLGVAGKLFTSRLAEFRARGAAVDIGGQTDLHKRVTLGLTLQNLGVQEAYDQVADPLPTLLRLGGRVLVVDSPEVHIIGAVELDKPWSTNGPNTLGLGAEYWYQQALVLRAGWRVGDDQGPFSLGVGFKWHGLSLDYAYNSLGDLGLANRFSLSAELGTVFQRLGMTVEPIQGARTAADEGPAHVDAPAQVK